MPADQGRGTRIGGEGMECQGQLRAPGLHLDADAAGGRRSHGRTGGLNRMGEADEVAAAILYLASDESAFVTGSELTIDGALPPLVFGTFIGVSWIDTCRPMSQIKPASSRAIATQTLL